MRGLGTAQGEDGGTMDQKILIVDPGRCTGCRICEAACSLHHEGECGPSKSRVHILSWEESGVDVPMLCMQCDEPICEAVCPTAAIGRDAKTNAISIDREACIGCRMCAMACPFGGITLDTVERRALVCNLCEGDPICVKLCPTGALQYISATRAILAKKREAAERLGELMRKLATPPGR